MAAYAVGVAAGASLALIVITTLALAVQAVAGRGLWAAIAAVVITLALLRDVGVNAPVPYRAVQVPQVLRYLLRPSALAFAFGAQLGAGFLTRYTYSTHTAFVMALPLALAHTWVAPMAISVYAVGKALVLVAAVGTSLDEGPVSVARARWRTARLRLLRYANVAVTASVLLMVVRLGGDL